MVKVKIKNIVAYFQNAGYAADGLRDSFAFSDTNVEEFTSDNIHPSFLNNAQYIIDTVNDQVIKNRDGVDLETLFDAYLGLTNSED